MRNGQFSVSVRENHSFLAVLEKKFIQYLIPKLSIFITPLHLTLLGFLGSIIVALSLVACYYSHYFILGVFLGLALNWFGDSLDGSLARYRNIERPRFGFLVDHATDLLAQVVMLVGFGVSPYLTMISALVILVMYLLFAGYTYVRVSVERVHQMSYGGMGATEFRILMGAWAVIAYYFGASMFAPVYGSYCSVDLVICALSAAAFVLLINMLILDAQRVAAEEGNGKTSDAISGSTVITLSQRKAQKSV